MKTKKTRLVLALLAFGAAGAWFLGRGQSAQALTAPGVAPASSAPAGAALAPAPPAAGARGGPPTVRLAPAQQRDVPIELQANGTVTPLSNVEIRPHVSRLLTRVHVKEGQFVRAGELLFTLDERAERAALDRARAQLARDKAVLADLERQYQRSRDLAAQNFLSASAADSLQSQAESQRALVQADQAALRSAQVELDYTVIRAPSPGRVGAVNVFAGSLVQANAVLASVTQIDPIAVSFTLPESVLASLVEGQKRGVVAVRAQAGEGGSTQQGRLSFIDSAVDPVAGTIRVKAQFSNADTALWPGQFVHARLTVSTLKDAVVVPLSAIVTQPNGALVYAVDAEQQAKVRKVSVLHSFGNLAAVSGLEAGEQIIVEGKQNLRPGAKVKVAKDGAENKGSKDARVALAERAR